MRIRDAARIVIAHCKHDGVGGRRAAMPLTPYTRGPVRFESARKAENGTDGGGLPNARRTRWARGMEGCCAVRPWRPELDVDAVGLFRRRDRLATIAALLLPPAACAGLVPLPATLTDTDAALVLAVVAVAAMGNRLTGYLATASAAVWFDFFLAEPYERLALTRHTDAQATVLLVLVGVAATELAVRAHRYGRRVAAIELAVAARRPRNLIAQDERLLAVVTSTAALVAEGGGAQTVIAQVCVQLQAILDLRSCAFEPGLRRMCALHLEPDGELRRGPAAWPLEKAGFPHEKVDLPARHRGEIYGRFALEPAPGSSPSVQARRTAVVLADLAAAALADDRPLMPQRLGSRALASTDTEHIRTGKYAMAGTPKSLRLSQNGTMAPR